MLINFRKLTIVLLLIPLAGCYVVKRTETTAVGGDFREEITEESRMFNDEERDICEQEAAEKNADVNKRPNVSFSCEVKAF
jgi:hypothetical protein